MIVCETRHLQRPARRLVARCHGSRGRQLDVHRIGTETRSHSRDALCRIDRSVRRRKSPAHHLLNRGLGDPIIVAYTCRARKCRPAKAQPASRMTSGKLLKQRKALSISAGYESFLSGSSQFSLTMPCASHRSGKLPKPVVRRGAVLRRHAADR